MPLGGLPRPPRDFWWPLQAQNLTSSQPLQAQLLPSEGLYRPNLCLTVDSPRPALASLYSFLTTASPGSVFPFWRLLQAQNFLFRPSCYLLPSSPGPALPHGCVYRPNSCLTTTSLDSATAQLLVAFLLPHAGLPRPCSYLTSGSLNWPSFCLALASLGPALFSRWPHQAHLLPQIYLPRPSSCLMVVSLTPAPASQWPCLAYLLPHSGHSRPIFCLMVASSGFALASQLPLPDPALSL
ncbi:putative uncharacterized protein FLJ44672 [Piliocolobus tephrosceles]|uniref:putative uncharacterized protein FLJ44672 n=1 Tax=Piliocolobus tephrosceles TaxID=591936 RepID=UPI000E6B0FE6|nr:putative uncharacterized protein FLJ44672 [Piliocolobus tephrosceles]